VSFAIWRLVAIRERIQGKIRVVWLLRHAVDILIEAESGSWETTKNAALLAD